MPNQFTPVTTNNQAAAMNQINSNFRKLDAEAVTKVFGAQNNPDKVLIGKTGDSTLGLSYKKDDADKLVVGKLPDGTYGIIFYDANELPSIYMAIDVNGKPVMKVAKEGKNAQTGVNEDLVFNSTQNTFKIVKTASDTVSVSGFGQFQKVIPHGLGQVPGVIGYAAYPSAGITTWATSPFPLYGVPTSSSDTSLPVIANASVYVDETNVTLNVVKVSSTALDGDWRFRYYLLQESAS